MKFRLEELHDKFPEIHKSIIIKADVLREGVRPSSLFREVAKWAASDSDISFEWSHEKAHTEKDVEEEFRLLMPEIFYLRDETIVKIILDSQSPYTIEKVDDKYMLFRDGQIVEEVFFVHSPKWYFKRTKSGKLMNSVAFMRGLGCELGIVLLNHCEYWNTGEQCRYCNMGAHVEYMRSIGRKIPIFKPFEDIAEVAAESYKECGSRIAHWGGSGGSLLNRSKEAENYAKMIRTIKEAIGRRRDTLYGAVDTTAMENKDAVKIYEAGIEGIGHNLEVWDPKLFEITCPGKTRYVGRENWINSLINDLNYWDQGKVQSSFVSGVEMVKPYGFKTIDDALESTLEGFEWLLTHGVAIKFNMWSPNPGSALYDKAQYLPPTEYWLRLGMGLHELNKKYGMYPHPTMICYRDLTRSIFKDFYHLM